MHQAFLIHFYCCFFLSHSSACSWDVSGDLPDGSDVRRNERRLLYVHSLEVQPCIESILRTKRPTPQEHAPVTTSDRTIHSLTKQLRPVHQSQLIVTTGKLTLCTIYSYVSFLDLNDHHNFWVVSFFKWFSFKLSMLRPPPPFSLFLC